MREIWAPSEQGRSFVPVDPSVLIAHRHAVTGERGFDGWGLMPRGGAGGGPV